MSAWNTGIPSDWLNFKILKTNFNNKVKGPVEPLVVQCIPILISVYKLLRIWIDIFNKVKGPVEPLVVQCIPILISVYKLLRIWIGIFNKVKGPVEPLVVQCIPILISVYIWIDVLFVLCTTVNLKITPCNLFYHLDLMSYY